MDKINGHTSIYGVIGNPVKHTKSPMIHNKMAERLGINMAYLPFHVEHNIGDAMKGMKALNIKGMNITVPYKKDVIDHLDEVSEEARAIGAVNTILNKDGKLFGYNTDITGLARACKLQGIHLQGQVISILGAGGTANAIAYMCGKEKVKKLYIINRTLEKAEALAKSVEKAFPKMEVIFSGFGDLDKFEDIRICIQTTSLGMIPNTETTPIKNLGFFKQLDVALDIVYNPEETKFLKDAKSYQVKTMNGLAMLYYQGIEAFEIWNDIRISDINIKEGFQDFYNQVYNTSEEEMVNNE